MLHNEYNISEHKRFTLPLPLLLLSCQELSRFKLPNGHHVGRSSVYASSHREGSREAHLCLARLFVAIPTIHQPYVYMRNISTIAWHERVKQNILQDYVQLFFVLMFIMISCRVENRLTSLRSNSNFCVQFISQSSGNFMLNLNWLSN